MMGMRKAKMNNSGQHLIEYTIVVGIISAAMIAMSTYMFRAVQSTQQMIQEEYQAQ